MRFAIRRWIDSLGGRLLVGYVLAAALTAALIAILTGVAALRWPATDLSWLARREDAREIVAGLRFGVDGTPASVELNDDIRWAYDALSSDLKYRVVDARGHVLLSSEASRQPLAPPGAAFDPLRTEFDLPANGNRLLAVSIEVQREGRIWYVQQASSQRAARLIRLGAGWQVLKPLAVTILTLAFLSIALVPIVLRSALRPLKALSQAAAKITPEHLETRLTTEGLPNEVRPLVQAFNVVLDRLERGFRIQQNFLAVAAHELKTPLALIRGQIELGIPEDRATLLNDVDHLARQVQQLLHLAEASERHNYHFEPVDVVATVHDVTQFLTRLAARSQVRLLVQDSEAVHQRADRGALFALVKNLVENAIQHTPANGTVSVEIASDRLTVCNEGDGIPEESLPHLFERYWRGKERRAEGAGLGLAICSEIAGAHGWVIGARNGSSGACFDVRF